MQELFLKPQTIICSQDLGHSGKHFFSFVLSRVLSELSDCAPCRLVYVEPTPQGRALKLCLHRQAHRPRHAFIIGSFKPSNCALPGSCSKENVTSSSVPSIQASTSSHLPVWSPSFSILLCHRTYCIRALTDLAVCVGHQLLVRNMPFGIVAWESQIRIARLSLLKPLLCQSIAMGAKDLHMLAKHFLSAAVHVFYTDLFRVKNRFCSLFFELQLDCRIRTSWCESKGTHRRHPINTFCPGDRRVWQVDSNPPPTNWWFPARPSSIREQPPGTIPITLT